MNPLPPSFTSLYRLFLRASSASVLHQNSARRQLRRLYRPLFDAAARAARDLENNQLPRGERMRHQHLLDTFQQQMDGTLSLLVNSAQFRGIPHRVVYNLNRLRRAHAIWVHRKYYSGSKNTWNPKATIPDSSKTRASHRSRDVDRRERNLVHEHCWDSLEEVVRMAEGRHNLSLGRLYLKPWTLEKR